mgnify:CR=1 FL=1
MAVAATALGMEHTESGTSLAGNVSVALQQVVGLAQTTSDSVRAISNVLLIGALGRPVLKELRRFQARFHVQLAD